jgi:hypothetical protein
MALGRSVGSGSAGKVAPEASVYSEPGVLSARIITRGQLEVIEAEAVVGFWSHRDRAEETQIVALGRTARRLGWRLPPEVKPFRRVEVTEFTDS